MSLYVSIPNPLKLAVSPFVGWEARLGVCWNGRNLCSHLLAPESVHMSNRQGRCVVLCPAVIRPLVTQIIIHFRGLESTSPK